MRCTSTPIKYQNDIYQKLQFHLHHFEKSKENSIALVSAYIVTRVPEFLEAPGSISLVSLRGAKKVKEKWQIDGRFSSGEGRGAKFRCSAAPHYRFNPIPVFPGPCLPLQDTSSPAASRNSPSAALKAATGAIRTVQSTHRFQTCPGLPAAAIAARARRVARSSLPGPRVRAPGTQIVP